MSRHPDLRDRPGRGLSLAIAGLAGLMAAGCAGKAENVLTPSGDVQALAPGATRIDILVATTRKPTQEPPGQLFNGERAQSLAFADVAISVPPAAARQIGEVQWPSRAPGDPTREFVALRAEHVERPRLTERLRQELRRRNGRLLLFVHGYNNRFEDAVMRFAQIAHDSSAPAAPFLFTWPSRGKLLAYAYDRESANYSRDALESVLDMLAAEPAVREVSIIAHSMGNWVTLEALRQIAIRRGRVHAKIDNVMLAAPDVDIDVFAKQVMTLGPNRPKLTLFVSRDDRALGLSRRLWGDVPRAGAINPEAEPYRSQLLANRVEVFDLTQLRSGGGPLNHDKFATSPQIVQLIGRRLAAGQEIHHGKQSLGEGIHMLTSDTVSAIGGVVSGVVAAPVRVLEGKPPIELD